MKNNYQKKIWQSDYKQNHIEENMLYCHYPPPGKTNCNKIILTFGLLIPALFTLLGTGKDVLAVLEKNKCSGFSRILFITLTQINKMKFTKTL